MNTNTQRLGDILASRMKKTSSAAVPITVELGKINDNRSLSTDSLKDPIPVGDYMINLMLNGNSYDTSSNGSHFGHIDADAMANGNGGDVLGDASNTLSAGEHNHSYTLRILQPGDRVLVVWCGMEPIVVAVVVSS